MMKKLFTERHGEGKARVAESLDDATREGLLTLVSARIDEEWSGCGVGQFAHAQVIDNQQRHSCQVGPSGLKPETRGRGDSRLLPQCYPKKIEVVDLTGIEPVTS